jgi:hypothetical protein
MNHDTEQELRELYHSHAQYVDTPAFTDALGGTLIKVTKRRKLRKYGRIATISAATVLVAAGLGMGALMAIRHLNSASPIIAIQDVEPSAQTATTLPLVSTASTVEATATALVDYGRAVKSWYDTYASDLDAAHNFLNTPGDPSHPTVQQIDAAKALISGIDECVNAFESIEPPSDIAPARAYYLSALNLLATGARQLLNALEQNDASKFATASASMRQAIESADAAQTTVEKMLGFHLSSN